MLNRVVVIGAEWIADVLGLSHDNIAPLYQRRYSDVPWPVIDLG